MEKLTNKQYTDYCEILNDFRCKTIDIIDELTKDYKNTLAEEIDSKLNDYHTHNEYLICKLNKLQQENEILKGQLKIREKENESLNIRINSLESIFRGRSRATKRTGDVYKDFELGIRKQVCDKIRNYIDKEIYNRFGDDETDYLTIDLEEFEDLLQDLEQAKESLNNA